MQFSCMTNILGCLVSFADVSLSSCWDLQSYILQARTMSWKENALLPQSPQDYWFGFTRGPHKISDWDWGESISLSCFWSYPFLLGCCPWWYQVFLPPVFCQVKTIFSIIILFHSFFRNADTCKHHWHILESEREEWTVVRIGCLFASIQMGNSRKSSILVTGQITILLIRETQPIHNLHHGLLDSIDGPESLVHLGNILCCVFLMFYLMVNEN